MASVRTHVVLVVVQVDIGVSPLLVRVERVSQFGIPFNGRIVVFAVGILVVYRNLQSLDGLELHPGRQVAARRVTVGGDTLTGYVGERHAGGEVSARA